jgi:hypothetical protein
VDDSFVGLYVGLLVGSWVGAMVGGDDGVSVGLAIFVLESTETIRMFDRFKLRVTPSSIAMY